ncbi:aspartic peptidase domain-containing protein [Cadophora sp. MPI-SDFR-AT-0126]|nr:aspartic peptidase domain-containing protein [Leotiomycetes sp. MPI-SDFR-AT-0126]
MPRRWDLAPWQEFRVLLALLVLPDIQDGNDGAWSTFAFQIGTTPQTVKLLPSTASYETWAIAPEGCQPGDPSNCHTLRGELYDYNTSTTWNPNLTNTSTQVYPLELEVQLGYTGKGRYGFDDITFGYIGGGGLLVKNQSIAGIATKNYFMGLFGLTPRSKNFTSFNNPIPSFMQSLQSQSKIPSLSWSYTAGNQYRLGNSLGSLVLGGYDSSRFIMNNLSFGLDVDTQLAVGLQAITTDTSQSLLPSPITAINLDSTLPYIYLPTEACTQFESVFGLTWNDTAKLYLLTDSQHSGLRSQNPSITFKLGTPPYTVDITLPYAAFDLNASWPLVSSTTPYFPLRRAVNNTYVLGRTFFQEAYVIADYEAKNFSISQCKWDKSLSQNIVTIFPPNSTNSTGAATTTASHGLPTATIVGICVGGIAIVLKAEMGDTSVAPPVLCEAEGTKFTPLVEIGDGGRPIYELPAREAPASEINSVNEPREIIARRNHVFYKG